MANLVGQTLSNRYHVQEFIGRGGMADVYKVWDSRRMVNLAAKVLAEDLALDKIFLRRFEREAQNLALLQHPNIVRFFGFEKDGRVAFILMDYVEGETLKHLIYDAHGPVANETIRQVFRAVCGALQFAHEEGVVHCDLKPANIMFNQHGKTLLSDFGIARMTDAATATMVGAGTPAYMAPEQILGKDPTPQTDIYSLGVVLFEMLTGGERPFTGERATTGGTGEKVRWEQLHLDPPSPSKWNPDISPELEAVVMKCLAKEAENRFANALDLLNSLELALGDAVIDSASQPELEEQVELELANERKEKQKSKSLMPLLGLGIFFVVLIALAGIFVFGGRDDAQTAENTARNTPEIALVSEEPVTGEAGDITVPEEPDTLLNRLLQENVQIPLVENEVLRMGNGSAEDVAISPDGEILAVGSSVGIWLYQLDNQTVVGFIPANGVRYSIAWSPDGERIAAAGYDGFVSIWDVVSGEQVLGLEGAEGVINSIVWSPDGERIAFGRTDHVVSIWDAVSGEQLMVLEGHTSVVEGVAWSPDGEQIASSSLDDTVRVWDAVTGEQLGVIEIENDVYAVAWSPDGTQLAAGGYRAIYILDTVSNSILSVFQGGRYFYDIAWSPDGEQIAGGGSGGKLSIWDAGSGEKSIVLDGHADSIYSIAWAASGDRIVSLGYDDRVRIWDAVSGEELAVLVYSPLINGVALSPDGTRIASGGDGLRIWNADTGDLSAMLVGHSDVLEQINTMAWSPDGTQLAADSGGESVLIWDASAGISMEKLNFSGSVLGVSWSPDGNYIAVGGRKDFEGIARIWDVSAGRWRMTLDGHTDIVRAFAWSPDETQIASGDDDGVVRVWDVASGDLLAVLEGGVRVYSLSWSPDGKQIAAGCYDGVIYIWDAANGSLVKSLMGHEEYITSVAWSPDGTKLASGGRDRVIRIWDAANGNQIAALEGHTSAIEGVAWRPDGTQIVSGSSDSTVRVWDVP